MKHTKIDITCDIKDCKNYLLTQNEKKMQVIFTTGQNDGRGVPNYLSMEKFDICDDCMKYLLKGNYVFGEGAQGFNTYYFQKSRVK